MPGTPARCTHFIIVTRLSMLTVSGRYPLRLVPPNTSGDLHLARSPRVRIKFPSLTGQRLMHGTVTKSELIERISERLKLPNGKAEQIVNCVFDSMVKALQEGEGIEIRGFGSFTVREYKAYEGRNPRTGETVHV